MDVNAGSDNNHVLGENLGTMAPQKATDGRAKVVFQEAGYKGVGARHPQEPKHLRLSGQFGAHLADQIGLTRTQGVNRTRLRDSDL